MSEQEDSFREMLNKVLSMTSDLKSSFDEKFENMDRRLNSVELEASLRTQERRSVQLQEDLDLPFNRTQSSRLKSFKISSEDDDDSEGLKRLSKQKPARKSIMELENELERDNLGDSHFIKTYPDFDHIKLDSPTVRAYDKFIEEVLHFEKRHRIKINAGAQISKTVVLKLISSARNAGYEVDESDFYNLKLATITRLMRMHAKPQSKQEFYFKLDKNTEFPILNPKYEVTVTNFGPLFEALTIYKKSFMRIYDFLSVDNSKNVPNCDLKDGGLLACFVDKIPFNYGRGVLQVLEMYRFDNVEDMLEKFFELVEVDNTQTFQVRPLHLRMLTAKNRKGFTQDKVPVSAAKVNNLEEYVAEFEERTTTYPLIKEDESHESSSDEIDGATVVSSAQDSQLLAVMPEKKFERGCMRQLFTSDCPSKLLCKYSHDKSVLSEMWKHYDKGLKASKYGPSQLPSRMPSTFSNVSLSEESMFALSGALNAVVPSAALLKAVYIGGEIVLDQVSLTVDKVLFDSGALSGSYIDKSFVDEHRKVFENSLKSCNISVKLADNKTVASITEVAVLKLRFVRDTKEYFVTESFSVMNMNSGNQVIIGLPTIIYKLSYLFQAMLEDAVNELCTLQEGEDVVRAFKGVVEESPEELETPLPCAFDTFMHFTSIDKEEALRNFEALLVEHVAPEFAENTRVLDLLRTKGVKVFIPQNWEGIRGIEPLELQFKGEIPRMKPPARPVNPKLFAQAKTEFDRMMGYMYKPSSSDHASALVVAPKATVPFIRLCGDYVRINKYIVTGHYPIPKIIHRIQTLIQFNIFLDIDMKNAFHQIKLGPITSEYLSIQTIWGQVAPIFLQEGVGPASGVLQKTVVDIFRDFEWMIVVFDNFLLCAHDYQDGYVKLEKFLDRCIERNVFCNFAKTWLGFREVNFFGYKCSRDRFEITEDRKKGIREIPFPTNEGAMRRFLGMILFCSTHMENYVDLVAPLYDMIVKGFDWNESNWQRDYRESFTRVIEALEATLSLFYPDYELPWFVRADASDVGVGGLLVQERTSADGVVSEEVIKVVHQKFSGSARNWAAIKKEAFALFKTVKECEYYLRGKEFVIKTDHANLRYIESSSEPIIIRWLAYLQGFMMYITYEKGRNQFAADFFSRLQAIVSQKDEEPVCWSAVSEFDPDPDFDMLFAQLCAVDEFPSASVDELRPVSITQQPEFYLDQVHGGRMGHHGVVRTWQLLTKHFVGHRIPYAIVKDYVASCKVCQKERLGMTSTISPTIRHLKPDHARSRIGMDLLTVTPVDKNGNQYIHVIGNHFTHHIGLYPAKDKTALTAATALFQHICVFGMTDELITDPGSDYTSEVMAHLNKWLGIRTLFSLVDRHESNGVECPSKLVLLLLRNLVYDERIVDRWSDPTVLPLIAYMLNEFVSSESGVSPLDLTFGRQSSIYTQLPADANSLEHAHEYVKLLDADLQTLRAISKEFQSKLILKRTADNPERPNEFQEGDFVLHQLPKDKPRPTKLTPRYEGPFKVIRQRNNDVECRHLVGDFITTLHVSRLKLFHGSQDDAYKMALLDNDQFVVKQVVAYRGEPQTRTTMEFQVEFEAGAIMWLPWSSISSTVQFEDFCRSKPQLNLLVYDSKAAAAYVKRKDREPITSVQPGDIVFVDIRSYGATWYQQLELPDCDFLTYVVEHKYAEWDNDKHTEITAICKLFDERFNHRGYFVHAYGSIKVFDSTAMVLLDAEWTKRFPKLLPDDRGKAPVKAKPASQYQAKPVEILPNAVSKEKHKGKPVPPAASMHNEPSNFLPKRNKPKVFDDYI